MSNDNKNKKDSIQDDGNHYDDIINGENERWNMDMRVSYCFDNLQSLINDPSVSSEVRGMALSKWMEAMKKNENKLSPEQKIMNDKNITSHILDLDGDGKNVNILDFVESEHQKFELLESAKREIASADPDTIFAATKAYSHSYIVKHKNGDKHDLLGFGLDVDTDTNDLDMGSIGGEDQDPETESVLAASTLPENYSILMDSMSNEEKNMMLKNYLAINDLAQEGALGLDSENLNAMENVSKNIESQLDSVNATYDKNDIIPPISFNPNSDINKDKKKEENEPASIEDNEKKNQENNVMSHEVDVDFKEELKRMKSSLMDDSNLIQLNKIPLVNAGVYQYDPELYQEGLFKSNKGRGPELMKVNHITGTSTIPRSSFGKSEVFDLAMINLALKHKDAHLTPPRRASEDVQKQFLKAAITSAMQVGEFDPSNIHVPKEFKAYKDHCVALLEAGSISNKASPPVKKNKHDAKNDDQEMPSEVPVSLDDKNENKKPEPVQKEAKEQEAQEQAKEQAAQEQAAQEQAAQEQAAQEQAAQEQAAQEQAAQEQAAQEQAAQEQAAQEQAAQEQAAQMFAVPSSTDELLSVIDEVDGSGDVPFDLTDYISMDNNIDKNTIEKEKIDTEQASSVKVDNSIFESTQETPKKLRELSANNDFKPE